MIRNRVLILCCIYFSLPKKFQVIFLEIFTLWDLPVISQLKNLETTLAEKSKFEPEHL